MKSLRLITLERAVLAVAMLAPTAACAKPADQATPPRQQTTAVATGVTLSTFIVRHEKKLLAGDTDGDGKVSRAEFLAAVTAGKGDPARRFARRDANGDGLLDKAEIEGMLSRRFKRLDTNGDGMLSADERAAGQARKVKDAGDGAES